jgi:hypothetical protein
MKDREIITEFWAPKPVRDIRLVGNPEKSHRDD